MNLFPEMANIGGMGLTGMYSLSGGGVDNEEKVTSLVEEQPVEEKPTLTPKATPKKAIGEMPDFVGTYLKLEEGFETNPYIPKEDGKVLDNSGVTVASGVDLGAATEDSFKKMGVSDEIIKKVKPYLGLKGEAANKKLTETPATALTEEEANELNKLVKKDRYNEVVKAFNKSSDIDWADLSDKRKAAITSVAFQYGLSKVKGWGLWKQFTEGKWDEASDNMLYDFNNEYLTRRGNTAALLKDMDLKDHGLKATAKRTKKKK